MAAPSFAADAAAASPRKGPSLVVQIGLLVVLTVMAAGMGWLGGGMVKPSAPAQKEAEAAPAQEHEEAKPEAGADAEVPVAGKPAIVPLAPITTNLAAPTDTWLRLELALEFKDGADASMAGTIQEDMLAYVRTVKLYQISGPSGFIHLKADLNERAKLRSEGKVAQVFVRSMVFE